MKPSTAKAKGRERSRPGATLADRFWPKVAIGDGCWLWTGATDFNGYGQLGPTVLHPRHYTASRLSWELHYGPIPDGLFVCHRCDVRPCVRPDHLFLGTASDNMRDCVAKGRHSPRTGEQSNNAKLTDEQVNEIRRRYIKGIHPARKTGGSALELSREFGITKQYVSQLARNLWRVA